MDLQGDPTAIALVREALDGAAHTAEGTAPGPEGDRFLVPTAHRWRIYLPCPSAHQTPQVYVCLHNLSDRPLLVALLNLTDRYRCHAGLFFGDLGGKPGSECG
ncbi:hypothetical protein ACFYW8_40335 [Streptomyces sp. NPDC002742]|uniref:hypothetical protein n=1 Tax=Streptomyces sp. NPDC002742 TaxID=3364663 RepID=UPI0036954332